MPEAPPLVITAMPMTSPPIIHYASSDSSKRLTLCGKIRKTEYTAVRPATEEEKSLPLCKNCDARLKTLEGNQE